MELLDVGLVEIDLGDGGGDLSEGEDTDLLPLQKEALDFFEFLEVNYRHRFLFSASALRGRQGI